MTKLRLLLDRLRSSFWMIPSLIVAAAVALAFVLVDLDVAYPGNLSSRMPKLFGAGATGSRGLLSAIASSMITIASVVFSITVVSLSLASTQYSPRILRNFVRDRSNKVVLGVFVGVFAYCLVVLRTVRSKDEGTPGFVPELAIFGAVVLAFVAIGFLIYFIHYVAVSIQATHIVMAAARETLGAVDRTFPAEENAEGLAEASDDPTYERPTEWTPVTASEMGYVQGVETKDLLQIAERHRVTIRMDRRVGEFVADGARLASVGAAECTDELRRAVASAFVLGDDRTLEQDPELGIRQIVDVALKALSAGINDTTTALICIDHLAAILARVERRRLPPAFHRSGGRLLLIARVPTFSTLTSEVFDQIRQNAGGNVPVLAKLVEVLEALVAAASDARRQALEDELQLVLEAVERTVPSARDRLSIRGIAPNQATPEPWSLEGVLHRSSRKERTDRS